MSIQLGNSSLECTVQPSGYVLHALLKINDEAVHFQRDVNLNWSQVSVVQSNVTQPPSIASTYATGKGFDFTYAGTQAVISSGDTINLYFRPAFQNLWDHSANTYSGSIASYVQVPCLELPATSAQVSNRSDCLVLEGNILVHYVGTAANANVSTAATGAATAIYTPYRLSSDTPYNIDALVLEGSNIVHYWMDGSSLKWSRGPVVSTKATAPASMVESAARSNTNDPGNFEALIPEGSNLVHYWRNNSDPNLPWASTVVVSSNSSGAASIAMAGYGSLGYPNLEALVQEGNTVYHYTRNNQVPNTPWTRDVAVAAF
jgi:hypothetical protein